MGNAMKKDMGFFIDGEIHVATRKGDSADCDCEECSMSEENEYCMKFDVIYGINRKRKREGKDIFHSRCGGNIDFFVKLSSYADKT